MILSFTMGIVMGIVAGLAIAALIYYLMRTLKAGQKAGVITGLIIGLIAGTAVVMLAGRIVVVKSQEEAGEYLVYGSPEYEFSNGFKLELDMGASEGYVLNDSKMELVLEKVVYTNSMIEDYYDILIAPMSITEMPAFQIHYYFSEKPPAEVESSNNEVVKYHLRTRKDYENEYGAMYYDPEIQSIPIGNRKKKKQEE